MKNRKINTSGEVTITRQKSSPHTGANAHRATMQCPDSGHQPDAAGEHDPEDRRRSQEIEAARDQHATDQDDGVRRDHRRVQR